MDHDPDKPGERLGKRPTRRDKGGFQLTEEDPTTAMVLVPVLPEAVARHQQANAADARGKVDGAGATAVIQEPEIRVDEAVGLAEAIDLNVVHAGAVPVPKPRAGELFGPGKVEELAGLIESEGAELVVIDHALSPTQQRNLERSWKRKVLDRTGLILEIFGRRARTREGKLQVELAHLTWQRARLVRSWTHLERQRGGAGFMGGPGETQIEADRRQIQGRISSIKRELEQVSKTRALHRAGRRRVPYPIVALVGYTNAGKSTLFNRLTGASVDARDQVFATLDPTMREIRSEKGRRIILSDTVGFISNLPTALVAAFKATLEEVVEAHVILHVRDMSAEDTEAQRESVNVILADLGIDSAAPDTPVIEVWNKIDLLTPEARTRLENRADRAAANDEEALAPVMISAMTGEGCHALIRQVDATLAGNETTLELLIAPADGQILAWCHEHGEVTDVTHEDDGSTRAHLRLPTSKVGTLLSQLDSQDVEDATRLVAQYKV